MFESEVEDCNVFESEDEDFLLCLKHGVRDIISGVCLNVFYLFLFNTNVIVTFGGVYISRSQVVMLPIWEERKYIKYI